MASPSSFAGFLRVEVAEGSRQHLISHHNIAVLAVQLIGEHAGARPSVPVPSGCPVTRSARISELQPSRIETVCYTRHNIMISLIHEKL